MAERKVDPAYTRDKHGEQLRRWAVSDAIRHLLYGDRIAAQQRITDSVLGEQARMAGIRVHQ